MQDFTLESNDLALLTAVLDHVCAAQHIRDDYQRATLGKRIILKAQTGERRFQTLAEHAVGDGLFDQLRASNVANDTLAHRFSMIDPAADPRA